MKKKKNAHMQFKTIYNKPLYKNSHWVDLSTVQGAKGQRRRVRTGRQLRRTSTHRSFPDSCPLFFFLSVKATRCPFPWFRNTAASARSLFCFIFFLVASYAAVMSFEWAGAGTEIHLPFIAKRVGQR